MQEGTIPETGFHQPKFATIDDMLELATKLVEGLNILGERKHPLDIRRGVRKWNEKEQ